MDDVINVLKPLAETFQVDIQKRFFPLNSMRLYYLLMAQGLSPDNNEVINKVNKLIPQIAQLLDVREGFLKDKGQTGPLPEVEACSKVIEGILNLVHTPVAAHTLDLLFSGLYPLQEELLLSFVKHLREKDLGVPDLQALLKIRAMDSVIYSTLINELLNPKLVKPEFSVEAVHWHVNIVMQVNDLVDAICYAKQDSEAGAATLVDVIRRIVKSPDQIDKFIEDLFAEYLEKLTQLTLNSPAQDYSLAYLQMLQQVVYKK